jgi:hypothetical protein
MTANHFLTSPHLIAWQFQLSQREAEAAIEIARREVVL